MEKNKRYTLAAGAALLLALGGSALLAGPAFAEGTGAPAAPTTTQTQAANEDGTNDGETADDAAQSHDEAAGSNEANEAAGTEANDDEATETAGHEDGTNDGESADEATQSTAK